MSEENKIFIALTPVSGPCFDFSTDGLQHERKTVFLVPLITQEIKPNTFQTSWACSRGTFCSDRECHYSKRKIKEDNQEDEDLPEGIQHLASVLDR